MGLKTGWKKVGGRRDHLVLLCENQEGYRNLIQLASTAFRTGRRSQKRLTWMYRCAYSGASELRVGSGEGRGELPKARNRLRRCHRRPRG
ncbi:MAG: PHP domain-containing protein [Acidobacteria bacterium]|nr:PHP domain-containing protein [Acidobacteriota bacterium]